ncbi:MAG: type II toxin-antitoxin system Phd/YefM family antitoxin [Candidatus Sumerlaeia bacterium]
MDTISASDARIPPKVFGRVAYQGDRVRIGRRGGEAVYLVSEEDYKLLEALEDAQDLKAAEKALRDAEKAGEAPVPLNQAKKELGL